ncbi:MAG: pilus assembly protein PilP [Gammaproteobacteria bacterium]|nr:pilus assembly protein PilP [Gammaproteobacteria bacterium]
MIEINLLPWRKMKAQQIKKNYVIFFSVIVVFVLASAMLIKQWKFSISNQKVITHQTYSMPMHATHSAIKNLKYVGYIHQQNKIWGIITLAQEAAQDVQVGMVIPEDDLSVISIDENKIVLSDSEKQHYVVTKSDG